MLLLYLNNSLQNILNLIFIRHYNHLERSHLIQNNNFKARFNFKSLNFISCYFNKQTTISVSQNQNKKPRVRNERVIFNDII